MYYVAAKMSAKCEWCSSFKSLCLNDEPGEKNNKSHFKIHFNL